MELKREEKTETEVCLCKTFVFNEKYKEHALFTSDSFS